MNIFDSHTHINSKEFANDLPDVVWRARALDVNMMLVLAYDQESADKLMELLENFLKSMAQLAVIRKMRSFTIMIMSLQ